MVTIRDALTELVLLKRLKDEKGKTAEYLSRQPIAWKNAIEALASYEGELIPISIVYEMVNRFYSSDANMPYNYFKTELNKLIKKCASS
jgi:hypothetical protein